MRISRCGANERTTPGGEGRGGIHVRVPAADGIVSRHNATQEAESPHAPELPKRRLGGRCSISSSRYGLNGLGTHGFAYRPFGGGNTVLRGGYGIFYDSYEQGEYAVSGAIYPWIVNGSYSATPGVSLLDTATLLPDYTQSIGPVTEKIVQANYLVMPQPNPRAPYVQQWSFSVEQELTPRTKFEINYIGSKGTHLFNRMWISQPLPPADSLHPTSSQSREDWPNLPNSFTIEDQFNGNANYNGMNVKLKHKARNFFLLAAYTWSKSLDYKSAASSVAGASGWPMNAWNLRDDYGPSSYDATQRLVVSSVYMLPVGRGKRFLTNLSVPVDKIVGGWQVNGIALFQVGFPFSIFGTDINGCLGTTSQKADISGNPYPSGFQRSHAEWFDTSVFRNPQPCYFGNSGRNILRAPVINNFDLSLFKNIPFTERLSLQLRLESFNAFNHAQFGLPNNNVNSRTLGAIGSTRPARINQIAMKVIW
jgi:hypothetical protein